MWQTTVESPFGPMQAFAGTEGLHGLLWPGDRSHRFENQLSNDPIASEAQAVFQLLQQQLAEYFHGQRQVFDLPVNLRGTEFQLLAWRALRAIPYGGTRTYQQQAASIGRPTAARAVGAANGKNPISIVVPCHRVVGKNGQLTGFAGGIEAKGQLLELERAVVGKPEANNRSA